jgi:general secretion pathway protein G
MAFPIVNGEMRSRGFTLIELLVALAIIATLLTLVTPRYFSSIDKAEETALKQNLALMRDTLDKYFADTGKYPASLDELVTKRYLRQVPIDPVTRSSTTWILVPPEDKALGGVFNVKSGATGTSRDGSAYRDW